MSKINIHCGDCLKVLKQYPDNYFTAMVTDPPYGLKFMSKKWDYDIPSIQIWKEVLRVLKPGGHSLIFGGTRTFHRLACAVEDAGFHIRDCVSWLYSSGFPKSSNISKSLDKQQKVQRKSLGKTGGCGSNSGSGRYNWNNSNDEVDRRFYNITEPSTEIAKEFDGYGTALKPSWQPIIIAMKPIQGNFAKNAMKHGVAGLNIDGTRIGQNPGYKYNADKNGTTFHGQQGHRTKQSAQKKGSNVIESTKGRWPANTIFSHHQDCKIIGQKEQEYVINTFDDGAKPFGDGAGHDYSSKQNKVVTNIYQCCDQCAVGILQGQKKQASRFFYCAKANKKQRGPDNLHPTVKPIKLMEYLINLVTYPDGNIILDPFMGSGSTLLAAQNLGIDIVGIDMIKQYCQIAQSRLKRKKGY